MNTLERRLSLHKGEYLKPCLPETAEALAEVASQLDSFWDELSWQYGGYRYRMCRGFWFWYDGIPMLQTRSTEPFSDWYRLDLSGLDHHHKKALESATDTGMYAHRAEENQA